MIRWVVCIFSVLIGLTFTFTVGAELDPTIKKLFEYRRGKAYGGIYDGRFRPLYVDSDLYLQPIGARVYGQQPTCAVGDLLRLDDEATSVAFRNKFDTILQSWIANRELVLIGKGTCTNLGAEYIFAVLPQ